MGRCVRLGHFVQQDCLIQNVFCLLHFPRPDASLPHLMCYDLRLPLPVPKPYEGDCADTQCHDKKDPDIAACFVEDWCARHRSEEVHTEERGDECCG